MRNEGIGRQAYQMLQDRPSDEKANILPSLKKKKKETQIVTSLCSLQSK